MYVSTPALSKLFAAGVRWHMAACVCSWWRSITQIKIAGVWTGYLTSHPNTAVCRTGNTYAKFIDGFQVGTIPPLYFYSPTVKWSHNYAITLFCLPPFLHIGSKIIETCQTKTTKCSSNSLTFVFHSLNQKHKVLCIRSHKIEQVLPEI